jgi:hypothetical protein
MAAILGLESCIYHSDFEQNDSAPYHVLKFKCLFYTQNFSFWVHIEFVLNSSFGVQIDFEISLLQLVTHSLLLQLETSNSFSQYNYCHPENMR